MLIDRNNWGGIRLNEASHFSGIRVVKDVIIIIFALTADFTLVHLIIELTIFVSLQKRKSYTKKNKFSLRSQ